MFCMKERPLYCRFGLCQFNGRSMKIACPSDNLGFRNHDSPCPPHHGNKLKDKDGVRECLTAVSKALVLDGCSDRKIDKLTPVRERKPSGSCLKTPPLLSPTSPKKNVRFADSMGMELEAVLLYEKCDADYELNLPESFVKSVYRSRRFLSNNNIVNKRLPAQKCLEPCFCQDFDILQRVHEQKLCLEAFTSTDLSVKATVRVANIATKKTVKVRFTINDWRTYYDLPARHIEHCGLTDKFTFELLLPRDFLIGCRVEFAISYEVCGQIYWDNNDDENYAFECSDNHRLAKV